MDKYERRRLRLLRIRNDEFDGKNAALAKRLGKAADYITRMLYEEGRAGRKRIGEDSVDLVMRELGIDLDEGASNGAIARAPEVKPRRRLQWVDDWESDLLSNCRATNDQGRATVMESSELVPKVLFDELASHKSKNSGG